MGFFCYPWMTRDTFLDPLRHSSGFQELVREVETRHRDALALFSGAGGNDLLGLSPSTGSSA